MTDRIDGTVISISSYPKAFETAQLKNKENALEAEFTMTQMTRWTLLPSVSVSQVAGVARLASVAPVVEVVVLLGLRFTAEVWYPKGALLGKWAW